MAQAASDKDKNSSWLDTLATAAAQLGAGQALAELRTQASELVSEVRRAASEAAADVHVAEERAAAAGSAPSEIPAELSGKIDALTSSLEEVADLLDAGLERLETVEMQLGDPDDSVDARLRSGIESCQRRLGGIEQQMRDLARAAQAAPVARAAIVVLVVDGDCRRRCDLCVTLEHRGLHTLAAGDAAAATHMLRRRHADAILVRSDAGPELAPAIEAAAGEDAAP
ncbi:MAG TPA: hypothetical protein VEL28_08750, partial [Candidatus Binatia bacterium]|nr:hypothetical protein [Candidatus Binatia bacterium]